ncbi:GLPGLI family protein [Flavobacterium sp. JP2137]|uniref:GLPGLI family protein n=1 Tax=Flavobacterium sp. JP2137 TaxID=3414510 RepID=UPI003D3003CF
MLKNLVLVSCLLCSAGMIAQTQRFVYKTTYKPDSLASAYVSETSVLDVVGQRSVYYSKNSTNGKFLTDEKSHEGQGAKEAAAADKAYLAYYVYKEQGKTSFFVYKGENAYQYEETEKIKWQIKDSIINYKEQYQAQLAETDFGGRRWNVFFTTQIPIPNGPYKFGGLPGLIVKATSADLDYNIELIEVQQVKEPLFERPETVLTLSKDKYLSVMKEHVLDPSKDLKVLFNRYGIGSSHDISQDGVMMKPAELFKITNEAAWEWMKTHNNPLEKGDVWLIFNATKVQMAQ